MEDPGVSQVMLDMHALPGCSTPFQSYAGIECAPEAPNFWEGGVLQNYNETLDRGFFVMKRRQPRKNLHVRVWQIIVTETIVNNFDATAKPPIGYGTCRNIRTTS